ncbi:MAG: hypothetical protein FJ316_13225 [SAR202 cluster bacterium]|nr:hypothetical protein [SAR202 cluster bacterium]
MTDLEQWKAWRSEEDDRLYRQYGKPLEKEHTGKFVAIGRDGRIILGEDDGEVLSKAIESFGRGAVAFTRVGYQTLGQWLALQA